MTKRIQKLAIALTALAALGAGLGLAIVRAITEAHGGQAHATNGPTHGADVSITLPCEPPVR